MKYPLIAFIHLWRRFISPLYGDVCKYYPSCSAYGLEAITIHGAIKGSWLTVTRLLRCHPWSMGGIDPVPGSQLAVQESNPQTSRDVTITNSHRHIDEVA